MNFLTISDLQKLADISLGSHVLVPDEYLNPTAQYYPFLFMVARALDPTLIVELGTGLNGGSTVHLAFGAPNAKVIGVDLHPPNSLPCPNVELWSNDTRLISQKVADLGIPIDLLFIDSTHESEHARLEFDLYGPLLRPGGVILMDDVNMAGMREFWSSVPEPKLYHSELHSTCGFGIAIR